MRIMIAFIFIIVLILAGCTTSPQAAETPLPEVPQNTATPTPLPSSTRTATPTSPPSATPTVYLSPTPTVTPTPFPTATLIPDAGAIPGRLYMGVDPYGYLDPNMSGSEFFFGNSLEDNIATKPIHAYFSMFSHYSQEYALVFENEDQLLELWLSDLDLTREEVVWVDRENWLKHSDPQDIVYLLWGPNDQFIIIQTFPADDENNRLYSVVYNKRMRTATQLAGDCDVIGISSRTNHLGLFCPMNDPGSYLVLESDGEQWVTEQLPEDRYLVRSWAFSKDGSRVIIASLDDKVLILDESGKTLEFKFTYIYKRISSIMKPLQWSRDGTKVLMYVDDLGFGHCKKDDFGLTWCWIVADSATGRVLWSASRNTVSEAALSPDGKWVAVSYGFYNSIGFFEKYTIVSSLDRRTVRQVLMYAVAILCWAR